MKVKVAVFDDNKSLRTGLQLLINSSERLKCVGAFENCLNVLKDISDSQPDVVLMDIDMPHVNGIQALQLVKKKNPAVKVIMQTVFEDDEKIFAAICGGADGYILKKTAPQKLIDNIIEVTEGGAPMSPSVAKQVLRLVNHPARVSIKEKFNLSERETEILSYLVQGLSYKMIAEKCFISYATVNTHVKHIYEKLQVHSAVEAVTKALQEKIV